MIDKIVGAVALLGEGVSTLSVYRHPGHDDVVISTASEAAFHALIGKLAAPPPRLQRWKGTCWYESQVRSSGITLSIMSPHRAEATKEAQ